MSLCTCDPDKEFNFDCFAHGVDHKLQARVKELENKIANMDDQNKQELLLIGENARLQKLVDMNQKVVDAARPLLKPQSVPAFEATIEPIREALRELDGENEHNDHVDGSEYGSNPHWSEDDPSRE